MTATPTPSGETLIRRSGEHWVKYVVPVTVYLLLSAVAAGLLLLAGVSAYHQAGVSYVTFLAGVILALGTHHWFFVFLLGESMTQIFVTNHRLIRMHESLFRQEELMEVSFEKMKTVEAHKQGLMQTLLRYGTLKFESGARIRLVPHPNSFAKDIEQAMGRI